MIAVSSVCLLISMLSSYILLLLFIIVFVVPFCFLPIFAFENVFPCLIKKIIDILFCHDIVQQCVTTQPCIVQQQQQQPPQTPQHQTAANRQPTPTLMLPRVGKLPLNRKNRVTATPKRTDRQADIWTDITVKAVAEMK